MSAAAFSLILALVGVAEPADSALLDCATVSGYTEPRPIGPMIEIEEIAERDRWEV